MSNSFGNRIEDQLIAALVASIDKVIPKLRSSGDGARGSHVAALALARLNRLVRGMITLRRADVSDVAGVLLRPAFELWIVGLYAILGDEEAVDELMSQYAFEVQRLGKEHADIEQAVDALGLDDLQGAVGRANWLDMCRKVVALLEEGGPPSAPGGLTRGESVPIIYTLLFRGPSVTSAHAGLGVLGRYHVDSDPPGVRAAATADDAAFGETVVAAVMNAGLASRVLDIYSDVDSNEVRQAVMRLLGAVAPDESDL